MTHLFKKLLFLLGPSLACLFTIASLGSDNAIIYRMAGVALWMAIWWIAESVPLAVTALIPIVSYPLLGILNGKATSGLYVNYLIFLFIGGFLMAIAMEKWNLHKRVSLFILSIFGTKPTTILFSFMGATWFLSMWISNTATTMMMVPIALSVVSEFNKESNKFGTGLFLGIAYAASIGGTATLVGTPPNLSFARIFEISFPSFPTITFAHWMMWVFPLSLSMLVATWALLNFKFTSGSQLDLSKSHFYDQYKQLPKMSYEEKWVGLAFLSMALLWLTKTMWEPLFPYPSYINDGTIAIAISGLLFIIPSKNKSGNLLDNESFSKLPWDIILLFGGGFALAAGFMDTGLSTVIGNNLQILSSSHTSIIVAGICFIITFATELTSNTATTELVLPILASVAKSTGSNPLLIMVPATLSASFAFMLPVATAPNTIIFGTGKVRMKDMVSTGVILNILGVILVSATVLFIF